MYFERNNSFTLQKFFSIANSYRTVRGNIQYSKAKAREVSKSYSSTSHGVGWDFVLYGLSFILSICILLSRAIYCLSEVKQMKNKMFHVWRELDVAHMTGGKQGCPHITHASLKEKTRGTGRQETITSNSHCQHYLQMLTAMPKRPLLKPGRMKASEGCKM